MKISLKLLDSDASIKQQILSNLRDVMDSIFKKALPAIKTRMRNEVRSGLISEPEYQSLISGKLKYEFGISSNQLVNNIIDLWSNNISINYSGIKISGSGLVGSLSLGMIESSYNDVLASDAAIIIDSVSGVSLPWLEWLLLYGGKIIVKDYRVQIGSNPRSRSGMAIMVESKGSNWRVPPEFAGTMSNNWVTRAVEKLDTKITTILYEEVEKLL